MFKLIVQLITFFALSHSLGASDYYWIGDGGEWSDLNNWATTSGGSVTHAQVPTSEDNVIFDANSFSIDGAVVEFNNEIVFVRSFTMTQVDQQVTIHGAEGVVLSCFGSLQLSNLVTWNFEGIINFTGVNTSNIIDFGGNQSANELYIVGSGEWSLLGDLEVDSIFQITEGGFNTSDFNIRTQYFYIASDSPKEVSLGNSIIEVRGRYGDREFHDPTIDTITAKFNLTNLSLDPGTSTINITAPITEIWFTGSGDISLYNVNFTSTLGRNYIRPYNSDVLVNWNRLDLFGSTRMEGSHNIGDLILHKSKIYRLENGQTITVDGMEGVGACDGGVTITSLKAGLAVNLTSDASINLDYATLRDINALGNGTFVATNSTDLGNNSNWSFTNSEANDFFWIGGSGNWLNPNHWSLTSGGPPSGCVPFGKDNAYFDVNSFSGIGDRVILNLQDIFIHDLIWEGVRGSPVMAGSEDNSMHITGSLRLDTDMSQEFGGYFYFESFEAGNTIEMNGQPFMREVHFSGEGADWTTLDDIYVQWNVSHHSGTINTNGNRWDIWSYYSFEDRPRHLNMRGSHIDIHDVLNENNYAVYRPEWWVHTNNYTSDTEASTIEFHSVFFAGFIHEGNKAEIDYNNVIFSSYGGELRSWNQSGASEPMTKIDTCIFKVRGQTSGNQEIHYLELTPGYDYIFRSQDNVKIDILNANGNCDKGHISLSASEVGREAYFEIANDHELERLIIKDIHNEGGTLTAANSIDQGNNENWAIDGMQSRTLYWVNNTGEWEDSNHWSLTSGGMGGECIPTPIDDVVFDELSFTENNQSVYSDNNRFLQCHNMTWRDVFGFPTFGYYFDPIENRDFGTDRVKIHGSLEYDTNMNLSVYWHHFATDDRDSVKTNGIELPGIQMLGYGEITFLDDLTSWNFDHNNGSVIMKDITWYSNNYNTYNSNDVPMFSLFENVEMHFGRERNTRSNISNYADNHTVDIINSTLFLDGPLNYVILGYPVSFDRVISTDPNGQVIFGDRYPNNGKPEEVREYDFSSIILASDATFLGQFRTDTLIGSPGKTYILEAGETGYIEKYLQLIGNNCTPIQLRSTSAGNLANLSMPGTSINVVNFIEMRDNNAIGGADFVAGIRSTDIGQSNRGWLFEDPPLYVETGFLGVDQALCRNLSLDLSAFNFSPGEEYLWSDGSTDTTLTVDQTGEYSVSVTFDNGCSIQDQIRILEPDDFQIDLGSDTIICEGTILNLDASIEFQGVEYVWSDSTVGAFIDIQNEGEYRVYAEVDGCISSDTIAVISQDIPSVDLGESQSACQGDTLTLSPEVTGLNVRWSDGSTDPSLSISSEGNYGIIVEVNSCASSDSVYIDFVALPTIELGVDTLLCEGQSISLDIIAEDDVDYRWQDAQDVLPREVTEESWYVLIGDRNGCSTSDSILVSFQGEIELDLGDDRMACEGEEVVLTSNVSADSYTWSDGSTGDNINISSSQSVYLFVESGVCSALDSVDVLFNTYPIVDIGPSDTIICSNSIYPLDAGAIGIWQDQSESQEFTIFESGTYQVVVDNNGCQAMDAIDVTIQEAPGLDIGGDRQACEGETVQLSSNVSADTYQWNSGDTNESIATNSNDLFILTIVDDACEVKDSVNVQFNAYPAVDFSSNDTMICQNETLVLTVEQEGVWQDGSNAPEFIINQEGLYHVTLDNNGCQTRDSIQVGILPIPILNLGSDTSICEGDQFSIQSPVNIDDFLWEDGSSDVERVITHEGLYWVEAFKDGCVNSDSIDVEVRQLPLLDLGRDTTVCDDEAFILTPTISQGSLVWQDGSGGTSLEVTSPSLIIAMADNGCISLDSIQVDFKECVYFTSYLPNIFSPNNDGRNDTFRPLFNEGIEILSYNFNIYDRWGGEVFTSTTIADGWNGLANNRHVTLGVYVFYVEIEYKDDIEQAKTILKGDVLVIN